jgi:L-aminopeptidase/D-esterase-like protein
MGKQGMISADSKPRLILSGEFVEGKKLRHIDALEKSAIKNSTGNRPPRKTRNAGGVKPERISSGRVLKKRAHLRRPLFSHPRRFVLCRATTIIVIATDVILDKSIARKSFTPFCFTS